MNNSVFRNLIWMYLGYVWFTAISKSVLATHIFQQGLTLNQMMLGQAIQFASQLTLLLLIKKYRAKASWILAIISAAISITLVINIRSLPQYYLSVAFGGLALGLFLSCITSLTSKTLQKKKQDIVLELCLQWDQLYPLLLHSLLER